MRVIPAVPRILLPVLLAIFAGIIAGCNSHPICDREPSFESHAFSARAGHSSSSRSATALEP